MVGAMLCAVRIDRHPAHGVDRAVCGHAVVIVPVMLMLCRHACTLPAIPQGVYKRHGKGQQGGALKRLNRIEGQVRGFARMVEDDRYCIDIVTQIGAVRAALRRAEEEILRDHVATASTTRSRAATRPTSGARLPS